MKKLLVIFDDDTAKELEKHPNMSEIVRNATQLYIQHILPDTTGGIRSSYKLIADTLKEIDSKIDYIARSIDA